MIKKQAMATIQINMKGGNVVHDENIIIGIDLGTTNSLVAYIENDQAITIKTDHNQSALVPSILSIDGQHVYVGEYAKERLVTNPNETVYSVKRLMGKSLTDVQDMKSFFSYDLKMDDPDALVRIKINDKYFTPIELSAEILKQLKRMAEDHLKKNVTQAVITVPAYFNDAQRQATRDAGRLAGLDVLRIVNEPTAASMAYGLGMKDGNEEKIAVYDLGGGTFDISILHIQDGIFEVLSTNGDTFLGGDDFDRAIIEYWIEKYKLDKNVLLADKSKSQSLRLLAEKAKKYLSKNDDFKTEWNELILEIDQETFNKSIKPIIAKTIDCSRKAIADAGVKTKDLSKVIMVGGSTRVRAVQAAVKDYFGDILYNELNPDEVVALGAAVQANILSGKDQKFLLIDVTPLSLGIETMGGLMDVIIPRNSKIPSKVGRQYTTSVDGQSKLKISVYQGERDLIIYNRKLGEFVLAGIPPMPAGLPKVEIQFLINADGILTVKARELRSGVETVIEVKPQYGLTEAEMARMLTDSVKYAQQDMVSKALLEALNEGKSLVLATDRFINQNKFNLSGIETSVIHALKANLNTSILFQNKDEILSDIDILNNFSAPIAHRMMDINISEALRGTKTVG